MTSILNGPDDTWAHAASRVLVRPLLGTPVRPNHLTALRVATGLLACIPLAIDARGGVLAFSVLWAASFLLDRADGELARMGRLTSRFGHLLDYYADLVVNAAVFLAMGVGLRHYAFHGWGPALGLDAGVSMALCLWLSEVFEQGQGGDRIWGDAFLGFHPDDALLLLVPLACLGWLPAVLALAAGAMTLILGVILVRLGLRAAARRRAA